MKKSLVRCLIFVKERLESLIADKEFALEDLAMVTEHSDSCQSNIEQMAANIQQLESEVEYLSEELGLGERFISDLEAESEKTRIERTKETSNCQNLEQEIELNREQLSSIRKEKELADETINKLSVEISESRTLIEETRVEIIKTTKEK